MKRGLIVLIALFAIAAAAPALAFTPHSPVLIDRDASQPQSVQAGEEIFIALPSNPTTGYAWTASVSDEKILSYEGNIPQPPSTGTMGAPGQQLFIFHANRSGSTTLSFSYGRVFESGTAPAKTLTYTITVQ